MAITIKVISNMVNHMKSHNTHCTLRSACYASAKPAQCWYWRHHYEPYNIYIWCLSYTSLESKTFQPPLLLQYSNIDIPWPNTTEAISEKNIFLSTTKAPGQPKIYQIICKAFGKIALHHLQTIIPWQNCLYGMIYLDTENYLRW